MSSYLVDLLEECGSGATEVELAQLERENGVPTPAALLDVWRFAASGRFDRRYFRLADGYADSVHQLIPARDTRLAVAPGHPGTVLTAQPEWRRRVIGARGGGVELFPFALNGTGEIYCIDLRDGSICLLLLDAHRPTRRRLAGSLVEFLESLALYPVEGT